MTPPPARSSHRRSLLFLVRFVVLLVVLYLAVAWNPVNDAVVVPLTAAIARVSGGLLNVLGERVTVAGTEIHTGAFAVQIENGCNGLEAALLFAAAVLAFPAPWRRKLVGLIVGFAAIQALNLVRVVSLFWIGAHRPEFFSSSHTVLWQSAVVLASVLMFLAWAARGEKGRRAADTADGP
jgi:exosortase H (IPTLxxWG-CTERM-specific)